MGIFIDHEIPKEVMYKVNKIDCEYDESMSIDSIWLGLAIWFLDRKKRRKKNGTY